MTDVAYDIQQLRVGGAGGTRFACTGLAIPAAALTVIIGPNGAGKSTLLRALAGFHGQAHGTLLGRPLDRDLARGGRTLAWVAQHCAPDSPLPVADYILLGRRPLLGRWAGARAADRCVVEALMTELELERRADVPLARLSGGERQRAAIARAVVQQTPVLLLDEPGNHLDIRHQHLLMGMLRRLVSQGHTVVCVLHELTLAANYADRLLLLADGRLVRAGTVADVLQPRLLSRLYRWPIAALRCPDSGVWRVDTLGGRSPLAGRYSST